MPNTVPNRIPFRIWFPDDPFKYFFINLTVPVINIVSNVVPNIVRYRISFRSDVGHYQ